MNQQQQQAILNEINNNQIQINQITIKYHATVDTLLAIINNLQNDLERTRQDLQRAPPLQDYNNLKTQYVALETNYKNVKLENEDLVRQVHSLSRTFSAEESKMSARIKELEEKNCELTGTKRVLTNQIESMKVEFDDLMRAKGRVDSELENYKKKYNEVLNKATSEADVNKVNVAHLLEKIKDLEEKVKELAIDRNVLDTIGRMSIHLHCGKCLFADRREMIHECVECVELNKQFEQLRKERMNANANSNEGNPSAAAAAQEQQNAPNGNDINEGLRQINDFLKNFYRSPRNRLTTKFLDDFNFHHHCPRYRCPHHTNKHVCDYLTVKFCLYYNKANELLRQLTVRYPDNEIVAHLRIALEDFRCENRRFNL